MSYIKTRQLLNKVLTIFLVGILVITNFAFVRAEENPINEETNYESELDSSDLGLNEVIDDISAFSLEEDFIPNELHFQINETKVKYQKFKYTDSTDLDGMTFAIVMDNVKSAMIPTYKSGEVVDRGAAIFNGYWMENTSFDTSSLINAAGLQNWLFEKGENGGYYIRNINSDYYLSTKEPNVLIYNSDNSKSEYDSSIRNRPSSLLLSKNKTEFRIVNTNYGIQFLDDSLGWTSNIEYYWKNNKFITTTWKANSYFSLYYANPFTINFNYPTTSFGQDNKNYGIITKQNGQTIIGNNSNRLLPEGEPIDFKDNTYLLKKPTNYDEVTNNYVVTNIDYATNNQNIDARNAVIKENEKNVKDGVLSIEDYICPGTQYKFEGYLAEDIEGKEVLLDSGTVLNWDTNENQLTFKAIKEDGSEIELKYGQEIKAKWSYISSLVSFHIDFTGTILADDLDIERRTKNENLTWAVAIGTIYNGSPLGNNTTMSTVVDEKIRKDYIVYDYDPNKVDTQITLNLYADIPYSGANKVWINAKHNNLENIQSHFFQYVKNSGNDIVFKVSPNDTKTTILNKLNSSNENYAVRWYQVAPDSGVGNINIKGVLVAKTSKTTLSSVIDGLPQDKLDELLKHYYIDIDIDRTGNNYLNLKVNENPYSSSIASYIENIDDSYIWEYKSLYGSKSYYKEVNNDVEGYKLVTVFTKDKELIDINNPIDGKENANLTLYNCYTEYQKGMVLISKTSDDGKDLKGAKFQLVSDELSYSKILTTNDNGMILFNNLSPGTYYLKEIEAPVGFYASEETWVIKVVQNEENVDDTKVYVDDILMTDTANNLIIPIAITNKSTDDTLSFKKVFKGEITSSQVKELFEHGYSITITNHNDYSKEFTLDNAIVSKDGMTYYWTLIDVSEGEYELIENNMDANYKSTNIEIELENTNLDVLEIDVRKVPKSANFKISIHNGLSTLESTSSYRDTIYLDVYKLSSKDKNIKLKDAKFHFYTSIFSDANILETPGDALKQIKYKDHDGVSRYAYYLKDITTNELGLARTTGLNYDADYILIEYQAPKGYVLDPEPIVVDRAEVNDNYINGILNVWVYNESLALRIVKKSNTNKNVYSALGATHEIREVIDIVDGEVLLSEPLIDLDVKYINKSYNYGNLNLNKIYQIRELTPPSGYIKDDTKYYVELIDTGTSKPQENIILLSKFQEIGINVIETEEVLTLYNDLDVSYHLKVNKIDGDTKNPIIDSGFTLYRLANEQDLSEIIEQIKTTDGVKECVKVYDQKLTTLDGDTACITFADLIGNGTKYYLMETKGVLGYLSSDVAFEITVNTKQNDDGTIIRTPVIKGIETQMEGNVLSITLNSYSKLEMPSSGSNASIYYALALGLTLLAISLLLLIYYYKSFTYF